MLRSPVLLVLAVLATGSRPAEAQRTPDADRTPFDVVLVGGRVLDGTGNPWFAADVGIRGGLIAAVGRLADAPAVRRVDVSGRYVLPGFVDLHSHAVDVAWEDQGFDSPDPARRAAPNLVAQGITTVAVNQDGRSPVDIGAQRRALTEAGIGINAVLMVGHGSVRSAVMGTDFRRPATAEEVAAMRGLVRRGMEDGAAGLSAGLEYTPGRWATTAEVVALAREIVPFEGVYIAHQRSEGADPMWYWPSADSAGPPTLIDSVLETIAVGEQSGATVVASHLKAKGAHYWGTSAVAVRLIQEARDRGVPVWGDQYPYTTSGSDGSTVLIPPWAFEGGDAAPSPTAAALVARVQRDPARGAALRRDIGHEIRRRGGADRVVVFDFPDSSFVGLSLAQVAERVDRTPVGAALWLQQNGYADRRGGARIRGFSMDESDLDRYAGQEWMVTASDAGIALPGDGPVHPRYYGTFPRKIRRYALDRGALSVEHAVRSSTSLPARLLGLTDRGEVRPGLVADLVVVDLDILQDRATAFEPHRTPDGVVHVILGGRFILEDGMPNGLLAGSVLVPRGR